MLIYVFPPHYQLVCANSYTSSFSLISYKVKSASVRFVVAWKPKDAPKDEAETAVLLADLILSL